MDDPLISILVPFKNTERFLAQCLDSILAQSYANWELLIVDDHSTDMSYNIVANYAEKDKRIKLFKNENSGIIAALRTAYQNSHGQFITRMDSDDYMHPEKLKLMLKDLQNYGRQHIALGLVSYFSETRLGNGYKAYEDWLNQLSIGGNNYSQIYKECVIPSPCWMVHRDDFEICRAFQPNTYPEDYDLAFRFYKYGLKCIPSENVLHYWRDHTNRASRTHEHYAENNFIDLKINYFLELDHDANRPLTLWGAGHKGKTIAKLLKSKNIPFTWLCDNPKKIGKHIYDVLLVHYHTLHQMKQAQTIVAVANPEDQQHITTYCQDLGMTAALDYFFFC
ncbi:glycosyltransferase family 2 protein [Sediminibacter sp. Hel_I_10]|uniref:glycosyltransferase family 2 protein n=1 Tax=Sediminibacter sp. Hel_I_10 TaxID=1392490 RepID=UPI00047D43D4|nr:glycosyltransferase family 2 protein [Sediminibacter sp. Hel_I_10]